jgi:hypothetical protein
VAGRSNRAAALLSLGLRSAAIVAMTSPAPAPPTTATAAFEAAIALLLT